jgi:hypothetical protein
MKAALEHLSRARGVGDAAYPDCLRLYAEIRDEAERWLVQGVRGAIEAGCTWAEVGDALGVSRQAAHERYAPLIVALARAAAADAPAEADRPTPSARPATAPGRPDGWRRARGRLR